MSVISPYIVKSGENIVDVVLNSTGNLDNWESILQLNNFTSWTPKLVAGQQIIIPDDADIQDNVLKILQTYPLCNEKPQGLDKQIYEFVNSISENDLLINNLSNLKVGNNGILKIENLITTNLLNLIGS